MTNVKCIMPNQQIFLDLSRLYFSSPWFLCSWSSNWCLTKFEFDIHFHFLGPRSPLLFCAWSVPQTGGSLSLSHVLIRFHFPGWDRPHHLVPNLPWLVLWQTSRPGCPFHKTRTQVGQVSFSMGLVKNVATTMTMVLAMLMMTPRYQSGPLDMMNLSEGRAPHEAITRVKQLEAVSIIVVTILLLIMMMMFRLRRDWEQVWHN